VSRRSLDRWLERGQSAKAGPFREFWLATEKALAQAELRATLAVAAAITGKPGKMDGDGQVVERPLPAGEPNLVRAAKVALLYLERRFAKRWGRKTTIKGEGPGGSIPHDHTLNIVVRRSNEVDTDGRLLTGGVPQLAAAAVDAEIVAPRVILPAEEPEPVEAPAAPAAPAPVMAAAGFGRDPVVVAPRSGGPTWD
jgi:hypothetical protein